MRKRLADPCQILVFPLPGENPRKEIWMERKSLFDGLSETLNKTAKVLSDRASSVYESSKIRSKINSEEKAIEKMKGDIGTLIYSRYEEGEQFEGEVGRLSEEIRERYIRIRLLEQENASVHGKKICPYCKKEVPLDAVFCPSCGKECPPREEEKEVFEQENAQAEPYEDEVFMKQEEVEVTGEEMAEVAESAFDDETVPKAAEDEFEA